jgi:hypothetical protein
MREAVFAELPRKVFNSIPNAVKFFIYDLLVEDAYQLDDIALCRQAVEHAREYLKDAQEESGRRLTEYLRVPCQS